MDFSQLWPAGLCSRLGCSSSVYPFIHSFISLFIHSSVHSFIHFSRDLFIKIYCRFQIHRCKATILHLSLNPGGVEGRGSFVVNTSIGSRWPESLSSQQVTNANDTHTRNCSWKPVLVSGASDMQFCTEFFRYRFLVMNRTISIFVPVYGTSFLPVFGGDFWYVCHWHKGWLHHR